MWFTAKDPYQHLGAADFVILSVKNKLKKKKKEEKGTWLYGQTENIEGELQKGDNITKF